MNKASDPDNELDDIIFKNVLRKSKNKNFLTVVEHTKNGIPLYKIKLSDLHKSRLSIDDLTLNKNEQVYLYHLRESIFHGLLDDAKATNNRHAPIELYNDSDRVKFANEDMRIQSRAAEAEEIRHKQSSLMYHIYRAKCLEITKMLGYSEYQEKIAIATNNVKYGICFCYKERAKRMEQNFIALFTEFNRITNQNLPVYQPSI